MSSSLRLPGTRPTLGPAPKRAQCPSGLRSVIRPFIVRPQTSCVTGSVRAVLHPRSLRTSTGTERVDPETAALRPVAVVWPSSADALGRRPEQACEALGPTLLLLPRSSSAGRQARRCLPLPGVGEQVGQPVGVDSVKVYVNGAEPLAPPELRARLRFALGSGEYSGLVEHHIHMVLIPQGCEDLARVAEGGPAVMVLLDRLRQPECERSSLLLGDHGRAQAAGSGRYVPKLHVCPSMSRVEYSREPYGMSSISRVISAPAALARS